MKKNTEKLTLNAAVVTKLKQTLSPDQLKQVAGGGSNIGGGSAASVC